ncbi:MAG TPA: serine hydrolase domain-containing protein [Kofleriaceae bacterium]|nr:serine hydrolase domain-containing protein [Kofleriaceae bacterium]
MTVGDGPGFAFKDPARRKKLEAAFPAIDKIFDDELKAQGIPGIALGIVIDGELAYAKGYGIVNVETKAVPDADTVYRIGSISKSFTALALLSLRDDGALDLDDPLAKWIPEANGLVYPTSDSPRITLRQLSNHTSGLPRMGTFDFEATPSDKIVTESLKGLPLESAPGTRWNYSNLGFGLLGMVVGRAAKSNLHDVVGARIWTPLGMTATAWDPEQVPAAKLAPAYMPGPKGPMNNPKPARLGVVDGAGGIYSSVRDMAKYVAFQMSAYPPRSDADGGKIKRATLREAHSTGVPAGFKYDPPAMAMSYGFGWSQFATCEVDDLVTHNGAIDSYRSEIRFSPSRGVGLVVLTNFGNGNPAPFADKTMSELIKTGAAEPRAVQPSKGLSDAMEKMLTVYNQWDEKKLASYLSRPVDPREHDELATYFKLHGACTTFEPSKIVSATAGGFRLKCERGTFEMELNINGKGLIDGFIGTSTGIQAPPEIAKAGADIVSLHTKWDDKIFKKYLANMPVPAAQMKKLAEQMHARHGDCKIAGAMHQGFDWGFALTCKKENVELWTPSAPDNPTQFVGLQLRPPRDEAKHCK